jgi:hypothetical protein
VGLAGGLELGAVASAFVPGVGPVIAAGLMGAALLGLAGGTAGAIAGEALESGLTEGLPEDELFVYEDALRKGRTVVLAFSDDEATAESARHVIASQGAESVDAARQEWWMGLRSVEQEHYSRLGRGFKQDEKFYRLGFEAALRARTRFKECDQVLAEMVNDLKELQHATPTSTSKNPSVAATSGVEHIIRDCAINQGNESAE